MSQHNRRRDVADHRSDFAKQLPVVENLQVVTNAFVERGPDSLGGCVGFLAADVGTGLSVVLAGAAAAVGQVPVVDLVAVAAKEHERSRHEELDIVGMGGDGDGGGHGRRRVQGSEGGSRWSGVSYAHARNFFGRRFGGDSSV